LEVLAHLGAGEGVQLTQDSWQYLTYTKSGKTLTGYKNGVVAWGPFDASNSTIVYNSSRRLSIGHAIYSVIPERNFNGSISDVRLYNRALSVSEINTLYNSYNTKASLDSLQKGLVFDMPLTSSATKSSTPGSEIMTDKTPYSNDGQNYGASVGSSYISFDGDNDYVEVFSSAYRFQSGDFSCFLWANARALDATYDGLITTDTNGDDAWKIYRDANNQYFVARFGINAISYPEVTTNTWHQYGYTKAGTNLSIFLDGVQVNTASVSATHPVESNSLVFGSYRINDAHTSAHMFNGSMSGVKIYNRALSDSEIKLLYDRGR
jgi:hypothetical protein